MDLEEWTTKLVEKANKFTKEIQLTCQNPEVDPHLLQIWEARRSLTRRWKKLKCNNKLQKRIALLTKLAEEYASQLGRQNWNQLCDR
ncbi:hypothetical protein HPB48_014469 [Haemaphysalis longicornis]|uniref:Uncharacterized protein n=1 Tax=Haemaphysalis longicornis TaxID=44386 RepID=A0A9J6FVJ4_HAELO|nr:hypothetical protein HPB48_014469 [Haemaphysalis longicornis]